MANWMRFERGGRIEFGTVKDGAIAVHAGDMFGGNKPTGETVKLADVRVVTPCDAVEDGLPVEQLPPARRQERFPVPDRAALFPQGAERLPPARRADRAARQPMTAASSTRASSASSSARNASTSAKRRRRTYIFGYTCVNDVTAVDLLKKYPTFDQWDAREELRHVRRVRPGQITTGVDPMKLRDPHHAQRQGGAELSGRRHVLPALQAGGGGLEGHDADARRHHRLRHVAGRRRDGGGQQHRRHRDRRRRHAQQPFRPGTAEPVSARRGAERRYASAWSAPAPSAA